MTGIAYVLCSDVQHTYLHFIGNILFHACHGGRTAEGTIRRHMDALLITPFQQSVILPVRMHLNLQSSHAHTMTQSSCPFFSCHASHDTHKMVGPFVPWSH